jgi:DHA2 family multidrug resistance protein-like MFS transporter
VPSALGFIVGSNLAPRIVARARPAYVIGAGLALSAIGLAVLAQVGSGDGLPVVIAGSVIISLGLSPVLALTTELIVGSAPPERAGAASGISETGAELGGALGISVLGSIGVAIYRGGVAEALPAGVPSEAATVARDTLGGAVGVAGQLPAQIGSAVLDVARDAFVQGMQAAATISAIIAITVAIIAVAVLRDIRPGSNNDDATDATDDRATESERSRPPAFGTAVAAPEA